MIPATPAQEIALARALAAFRGSDPKSGEDGERDAEDAAFLAPCFRALARARPGDSAAAFAGTARLSASASRGGDPAALAAAARDFAAQALALCRSARPGERAMAERLAGALDLLALPETAGAAANDHEAA